MGFGVDVVSAMSITKLLDMEYALLIEDHPLMADAIGSSLWRWLPGLQIVRAYSWDEARAVLQTSSTPPAFVVTDLQLPDSTPERTLQSLRQWQPDVPVLALTMLDDMPTQRLCTAYKVLYLCKTAAADQLKQTLQNWLGQDRWAHWCIQPMLSNHPMQGLTARQIDILRELANGRSNREIADFLHISEDTVRTHIKTLFSRLKVKNRTQASKIYLQCKDGLPLPQA